MLRWFQMLMPKEGRFFGLFARHAEAIVAGATNAWTTGSSAQTVTPAARLPSPCHATLPSIRTFP